jgi:hypothetical protein
MRLHVHKTLGFHGCSRLQWWVDHESTKATLHILFLQFQETRNNLKLQLGGPLAVFTMVLPMMYHQGSWMVLIPTSDAPLFQHAYQARNLPEFVKLACTQSNFQCCKHGHMGNGLQQLCQ